MRAAFGSLTCRREGNRFWGLHATDIGLTTAGQKEEHLGMNINKENGLLSRRSVAGLAASWELTPLPGVVFSVAQRVDPGGHRGRGIFRST